MPRSKKARTWTLDEVQIWFNDQLPDDWFSATPELVTDRDEILVTGELSNTDGEDGEDGEDERRCIAAFRESTRDERVQVARRAEHLWGRKISWAVRCGEAHETFTVASVPVMTRLRLDERQILDTLIDAGVARSRSDALGWCVRLVAENEREWIDRLRDAMTAVEKVRREGPGGS